MQVVELAEAGRQLVYPGMEEVFELDIWPGDGKRRTSGQGILRPAANADPHEIHSLVRYRSEEPRTRDSILRTRLPKRDSGFLEQVREVLFS